MPTRNSNIVIVVILLSLSLSCKKGWLDAKPSSTLVVPTTVANLQALLDYPILFNSGQSALGELATDDYLLMDNAFNSVSPIEQNSYIWATDVFANTSSVGDWDIPYNIVLQCNLVLDKIAQAGVDTSASGITAYNNVKGSALYYRSIQFFGLVQTFAKPFDSATFTIDPGIPLKMSYNVNQVVGRSTIQQCFNQIIGDLQSSVQLLPATPLAANLNRPSKVAAYGQLARIFLSISDYSQAKLYCDSVLQISNALLDFNTLDPTSQQPIPYPGNPEMVYDCEMANYGGLAFESYVDSSLYQSYDSNDLRKSIFFTFDGTYYKFLPGNYYPYYAPFNGIATDEIYLTRAECFARLGDLTSSLADLNVLLSKRYNAASFTSVVYSSAEAVISRILLERRRELLFRGTRWLDLRRINRDAMYKVNLTRIVNGSSYNLPAGDLRYTYPIPPEEIMYNPISQNER
jgi:hypothetical protein